MQCRKLSLLVCYLLFWTGLFVLALNACGSGGDGAPPEPADNDTGGITFQLQFEPRPDQYGLAVHKEALADPDICADYLVQDIQVNVYRSSDETLDASVAQNCEAHELAVNSLSANVDLEIVCQGYVNQQACWEGRIGNVVVDPGRITHIGTIVMTYICEDQTPPRIETSYPGNSTDVSVNTTISVRFNEPLAPSTISDQAVVLSQAGAIVAGEVSYESATYTINFTPQQDLEQGRQYQYSLTATQDDHVTDTAGLALIGDFSWQFTTGAAVNQPPTALIEAPADGSQYALGDMIRFSGSGNDPEEGALGGDALTWSSDLGGRIGTGSSFSTGQLSEGTHIITLTATDSQGAAGSDSISMTVAGGDIEPPSVPTNLGMDGILLGFIIAWDESTDNIGVLGYNIYRDGVFIDSTSDRYYTDSPLTTGIRYCYRVSAFDAAGNESQRSGEICATR
jgi:hypothetical protein